MSDYSERDLVLPALVLLEQQAAGLTTTQMINELVVVLNPDGADVRILAGRRDTHFSQKVRNLVSHRTLERGGLETYDARRAHHAITPTGRRYVEEARKRGEIAAQLTPTRVVGATAVFPGYRRADEAPATKARDPFIVDPNEVDRALGAHAATQNALADWVAAHGWTPLSPGGGRADFDLSWHDGAVLNVAEVKSVTTSNESRQLRLGLGQVLHYTMLLGTGGPVRPVLAIERAPADERWLDLCREHGVVLVWPAAFDVLLPPSVVRDGQMLRGPIVP
jgi:hypothetical protein